MRSTSGEEPSDFWLRWLRLLVRHPRVVVALTLALTVGLVVAAAHIRLNNTRDLWLPAGDRYVETTKEIQTIFGGRDIVVVGIEAAQGEIYQPAVLQKIVDIQDRLLKIPEAIRGNTASLAASKVRAIKGTSEGMEVTRIMERVPQTPEELAALRQRVDDNPFYVGALVSADRRFAAIVADFRMKPDAQGYTELNNAIMAAVDASRDDSVRLYVGGAPIAFAGVEIYSNTRGGVYFAAAFVIIMLVQWWAFRSVQGMLLPMVTALLSTIWAMGLMQLAGFQLNSINTTTCILVMAVTSGHAIQLLKRYYEEFARLRAASPQADRRELSRRAVVVSVSRVGAVMVTAGLIASLTLYSLMLSKIALIRQFGFIAGTGVLSGLLIEMSFVPALRSLLRPPRDSESAREQREGLLDRMLRGFARQIAGGRAPLILGGSVALILAIGAGTLRLHGDSSIMRYFAKDDPVRVADEAINHALGGTNTVYFLVETAQADGIKDPKVLAAMEQLQAFLAAQPDIGKTQSLADLIKRMNRAMHGDDAAYDRLPDDQALIAQYLLLYSLSGGPEDFSSYVDNDYRRGIVWAFVRTDSTAYAQSLFDRVQPLLHAFPEGVTVRIGGTLADSIAVNEVIVHEKIVNTAQMAVVIFVLTSLMLRSVVGGLFVLAPVLIIALANFGIMGWLGIPLDMGTATTASMAISIGADYEIYLLYRFREELRASGGDLQLATERSLMSCGKAVIFVAAAVAGGYSALLASDFTFYSRLGTTVAVTMLVSAFSALVFLRAMMLVFRPRFIFGDAR